jgi:hypothetical protein
MTKFKFGKVFCAWNYTDDACPYVCLSLKAFARPFLL